MEDFARRRRRPSARALRQLGPRFIPGPSSRCVTQDVNSDFQPRGNLIRGSEVYAEYRRPSWAGGRARARHRRACDSPLATALSLSKRIWIKLRRAAIIANRHCRRKISLSSVSRAVFLLINKQSKCRRAARRWTADRFTTTAIPCLIPYREIGVIAYKFNLFCAQTRKIKPGYEEEE